MTNTTSKLIPVVATVAGQKTGLTAFGDTAFLCRKHQVVAKRTVLTLNLVANHRIAAMGPPPVDLN
ncbi:hypothetical protein [Lactiplantibacillus pingfangensis]|uniref:hypothetical protein n=1 Tax=Lactiplantibacillus pingfangensis TaxID=2559915 RepID=UPI0010F811FC|nr:hypothetical protein [Lactiplantibacillus pingfangensis]